MNTDERYQVLGKKAAQLQELLRDQKCLRLKVDGDRSMLDLVLKGLNAQQYGGRFLPSLEILIRQDFLGTLKELATVQEQIDQLCSDLDISSLVR